VFDRKSLGEMEQKRRNLMENGCFSRFFVIKKQASRKSRFLRSGF
jgi:hypothetical protein